MHLTAHGLTLWAALLIACPTVGAPPHVLWISCEDTSPDLGCYGDAYATTPNLDRFAAQGCRFTRAFAAFPVCAPSRSAIITGVSPGTLGSMHMRTGAKGYEAVPPPGVKCFTEYLRAAGYYCVNQSKTDYQFDPPFTAWDARKGDWRNADRPAGQPFFCVINITTTHESQCWDISAVQHDPARAPLPPFYPDTPKVRQGVARYYDQVQRMDQQVGDILRRLEADGLASNTVVFFWGDHGRGLPRFKRWPYDSGLRVPLLVRWPGRIAPGTVNEELAGLFDLGPTTLAIAGVERPAYLQGRPLLGDSAGPEPAYIFGGRNRMDLASDDFIRTCRDRRFRYIKNFTPQVPYAQVIPYQEKSPILQDWRRLHDEGKLEGAPALWFLQPKPEEELYDTESDPSEVHNLAADPAQAERLQTMRAAVAQWMADTHDLGGVPEDELIQRFKPDGKQPVTAAPEFADAGPGLLRISCATEGASIGYRIGKETRWQIYSAPTQDPRKKALFAKAIRIGYAESAVATRPWDFQ